MQIITNELRLNVSGFGGVAANRNYAGTAFALMDKMWPIVKGKGLKHKGLNIWVYEEDHGVFAGVELEQPWTADTGLELKTIILPKYAYYKHIGSYNLLGQAGENVHKEIRNLGLKATMPYIEIYGHWTDDDSKLETEIIVALE